MAEVRQCGADWSHVYPGIGAPGDGAFFWRDSAAVRDVQSPSPRFGTWSRRVGDRGIHVHEAADDDQIMAVRYGTTEKLPDSDRAPCDGIGAFRRTIQHGAR